jgi:hypothetical protein
MWCWRNERNEEQEERNILQTIKRRKANWIGHILYRNCLLKYFMKERQKKEDKEEYISSYWMALRKQEDTEN